MGEYKSHHYVPICYLANFGIDGNKDRKSRVFFYCVDGNFFSISSVEKRPTANNFYDSTVFQDEKTIEHLFNEIEGVLAELLRKLFQQIIINPLFRPDNCITLSEEDRGQLSFQTAMMIVRTRAFRNNYCKAYTTIKQSFPFADIPDYSKKDFQRIHTNEIIDFGVANFYSNLFDDCHCRIVINHTNTPFITSDNPAIKIIHDNNSLNQNISPVSEIVSHFMPLNPYIGIEFCHKSIVKKDMIYFDIFNELIINFYNNMIIENATQFLFSNQNLKDMNLIGEKNDKT